MLDKFSSCLLVIDCPTSNIFVANKIFMSFLMWNCLYNCSKATQSQTPRLIKFKYNFCQDKFKSRSSQYLKCVLSKTENVSLEFSIPVCSFEYHGFHEFQNESFTHNLTNDIKSSWGNICMSFMKPEKHKEFKKMNRPWI